MTADYDLFPPKAAAAIRALVPGKAWKDLFIGEPAAPMAFADWIHVRGIIRTPAALDKAVA